MASNNQARLRIVVTGRVQGVFFRQATAEQARSLAITGWVRNLADGSVEILAEGQRSSLEMLLAWAHHGPLHARVDGVEAEWHQAAHESVQFRVR